MKNFAYGLIMAVLLAVIVFTGYLVKIGLDRPPSANGRPNDMVFFGCLGMATSVFGLFVVCLHAVEHSGRK